MKIEFTKMQSAGNDYIYVDVTGGKEPGFDPSRLSREMSRRRFSVGSDGLILIKDSETADLSMEMFNADGSEGAMCGNAIRCVAKLARERGICEKDVMDIETASGIRTVFALPDGKFAVDMGRAVFYGETVYQTGGGELTFYRVSVGNPHAVCFVGDAGTADVHGIGAEVESLPEFGERVNVEFAEQRGPAELKTRVWERGSGETLACGTGACAAAAAAVRYGRAPFGSEVFVEMPGGTLSVTVNEDYGIILRGGAESVYSGVYEYAEDRTE